MKLLTVLLVIFIAPPPPPFSPQTTRSSDRWAAKDPPADKDNAMQSQMVAIKLFHWARCKPAKPVASTESHLAAAYSTKCCSDAEKGY
jgi:hypothetical protein